MAKFDQNSQAGDLTKMALQIKQSTELDEASKHNLLVDLNNADWESSKSRKIFSFIVLGLLLLG